MATPMGAWSGLALYAGGFLLVAARFVAGAVRTSRMVRLARPAVYAQAVTDEVRRTLGIRQGVGTLESSGAAVPMTWGMPRPVVLLPEAARHWPAERLHAVVLHELIHVRRHHLLRDAPPDALLPEAARHWPAERLHAVVLHELIHVRRHDLLAQFAAQSACCLYWFHPLVWLAARELRKERERACDDAVLGGGVAAPDYAGHLLELARGLGERRRLGGDSAVARNRGLGEGGGGPRAGGAGRSGGCAGDGRNRGFGRGRARAAGWRARSHAAEPAPGRDRGSTGLRAGAAGGAGHGARASWTRRARRSCPGCQPDARPRL